jgi:hypothetical protein
VAEGVVDGHLDGPADGTQTPAVGAKCVTTRRIGGARLPSTSELVHIDPPRTWGVRGTDGPIRAAVDVLVEPVTAAIARSLSSARRGPITWRPNGTPLPSVPTGMTTTGQPLA